MKALNKFIVLLSAISLGIVLQSHAQDSADANEAGETVLKAEELQKEQKKKDIDNEITNKKLRAELGSKSKYSMSMDMNYLGGPVEKPFGKERPNLTGSKVAPAVLLSGRVKGRYRIDERSSLSSGVGVNIVQPFHDPQENQGHSDYFDKAEVDDPSVSYSYAHKWNNLQVIWGAGGIYYTNDRDTADSTKRVFDLSFDNTLLKSIGKTGLQVGLVSAVWGSVFESDRGDRHYKDLVTKKIATEKGGNITSQQDDYYLAFYPFVEYVINDTFNLRTVFRQTTFYHVRSEKGTDLVRQPGSQSIGLGISVTRDIFLYPNFQFSTENLSTEWVSKKFAKESTVGMSATINMF